jgi:hypothetical protein
MAETTGASSWSLEGLKDALTGGNKANATEEDKTQAALNAALREETKLKEERGEATSGWRKMVRVLAEQLRSIIRQNLV